MDVSTEYPKNIPLESFSDIVTDSHELRNGLMTI